MIKALLLIFDPIATWDKIARARRSIVFIVAFHLLPLLVLTSAVEGYGLVRWGKYGWRDIPDKVHCLTVGEAVILEVIQILLSLAVVFAGAKMVKSAGETFHGRHTYNQAFAAVAYGLSPLFSLRLLDAFAGVNPWVAFSIGIVLSLSVLYNGVPRMMEPDPSHALGLFFISSLLLILITGIVRLITERYLAGKFIALEKIISNLAARLPF